MQLFRQKKTLRDYLSAIKTDSKSVGFVPTMGALHEGHLSLVKQAWSANDVVVVSIFVNPTQFDNPEDLEKYPVNFEEDIEKLRSITDALIVFMPRVDDIYDKNIKAAVFDFGGLEFEMEGKYREGHFNGVATIVKKLLEAVQPDRAYFGEKDYQQLLIVKSLVKLYHLPVHIIACPTQREAGGLAMSSRNERLSATMRKKAAFIYKTLVAARERFRKKSIREVKVWVADQFENHTDFSLEYVEIADAETLRPVQRKAKGKKYRIFIAVYANHVRLIDNIALN
ncbi:MAG: pantoate--beta-alanine ligase [Bacteroidota bacterium]